MEPVDLTLKLAKHCRNSQHLPFLINFCLDQLFEKVMILKTVRFSYPLNFFPQGFEEISKKVLAKIGRFLNEPVALMLEFTKHCRKRQNSHFLLNFFFRPTFLSTYDALLRTFPFSYPFIYCFLRVLRRFRVRSFRVSILVKINAF